MGPSPSSAAMCGSIPTTSTTATAAPTISRRSSTTSSIGITSARCTRRPSSAAVLPLVPRTRSSHTFAAESGHKPHGVREPGSAGLRAWSQAPLFLSASARCARHHDVDHCCGGRRGDFPRLRARLGRLHPRAIRRSPAFAVPIGLRGSACLHLRQSLHVRRRVAGPLGGLVALVLLATCPLYYGHMFMNPKDAPFAAAMALLLLGLVRSLEEYPRATPQTVALFGVGLGLAVGSRIIGGMAGLYAAAAIALIIAVEARRSGLRDAGVCAGRFVLSLAPGLVIAYLV